MNPTSNSLAFVDPNVLRLRKELADPVLTYLKFLTPNSEPNYFADEEREIIWGRNGNGRAATRSANSQQ